MVYGVRVLLCSGALTVACRASAESDAGFAETAAQPDDTGESGSSSGGEGSVGELANSCLEARIVTGGSFSGSLRGKIANQGGACGNGERDAYLIVEPKRRSDISVRAWASQFEPVVGILPSCGADWSTAGLLCTQGVRAWLTDVAAGTQVAVAVGIRPEDPILAELAPGDPLSFVLDVELREILNAGEVCESTTGRCVSGTQCAAGQGDPVARCTTVASDTCQNASRLEIGLDETELMIDRATVQTDAHAHSCVGERRAERVVELVLPTPLAADTSLVAETDASDVGLALRGPGCRADAELGCATGPNAQITVANVEQLAPSAVFLFVEFPSAAVPDDGTGGSQTEPKAGEEAPLSVRISVLPAQ